MRLTYFIIVALLCLVNSSGICQTQPFDITTIYCHTSLNNNQNRFHEFWDISPGLELTARTTFYFGQLELGALVSKNSAIGNEQTDYLSIFTFIGWGYKFSLNNNLSHFTGIRLGNYYMNFDDPTIHTELKTESEMSLGLVSNIQYKLDKNWSVQLGAEYQKVYTYRRIHLSFISAGIGYTFDSPGWLRKFLK